MRKKPWRHQRNAREVTATSAGQLTDTDVQKVSYLLSDENFTYCLSRSKTVHSSYNGNQKC